MIESHSSHYENVKNVLSNVKVEMAVFDNHSSIIDNEGLFYQYANAIILGNFYKDDRRLIVESDNSFRLLRTQIDIVPNGGYVILNADDPNVTDFLPVIENINIIYYSMSSSPTKCEKIVYYDNVKKSICLQKSDDIESIRVSHIFPEMLAAIAGIWSYVDLTQPSYKNALRNLISWRYMI